MSASPHLLYEAVWTTYECNIMLFTEPCPIWSDSTFQERTEFMERYKTRYEAAVKAYKEKNTVK